jgi:PIN domain nuclease of toxin-antitoxin system
MKILIDSHYLFWATFDSSKIKPRVRRILEDDSHTIIVSTVSVWELSIKRSIGKLIVDDPDFISKIESQIAKSSFGLIELVLQDSLDYSKLRLKINKDPFDRMLIVQALRTQSYFLSVDENLDEFLDLGLKIL